MNNMPKKLRDDLEMDPFYHRCARKDALDDHECQGDPIRGPRGRAIEWDHALIFAGKQVQKKFAIVPLCWYAHRGPGQYKAISEWISLNRATDDELLEISHKGGKDYFRYRAVLNARFGVYKSVEILGKGPGINYGYAGGIGPVYPQQHF